MATMKVQYEKVLVTLDTPGTTGTSAVSGTMVGSWTALVHSLKVAVPTWSSSACTACYLDMHDGDNTIIFTSNALANATSYVLTADRMIVTDTPTFRVRTNAIESTAGQGASSMPTVTLYLY